MSKEAFDAGAFYADKPKSSDGCAKLLLVCMVTVVAVVLVVALIGGLGATFFPAKPSLIVARTSVANPGSTLLRRPPGPSAPAPDSDAFLADVAQSKRAAVARYPLLGVRGSPLNLKFVTTYAAWQSAHDPRLTHSNWPEILAAECAPP